MQLFLTYLIIASAVFTALFRIYAEMKKVFRRPSGCSGSCAGCAVSSLKDRIQQHEMQKNQTR